MSLDSFIAEMKALRGRNRQALAAELDETVLALELGLDDAFERSDVGVELVTAWAALTNTHGRSLPRYIAAFSVALGLPPPKLSKVYIAVDDLHDAGMELSLRFYTNYPLPPNYMADMQAKLDQWMHDIQFGIGAAGLSIKFHVNVPL